MTDTGSMAISPATHDTARAERARPDGSRPISGVPYLPGMDGMRALAVIAVMIYHANSDWLPGGYLGVEVFFVISGYLITLLIVAEHERSDRIDLKAFWIRRARRLLPALFTMLLLVIVYTAIFVPDALGQLRGDVVAALTYVTNWYQIWQGQGYTAAGDFAPLRHLWSLAVEEQFYLLWPLVMVALLSAGSRHVARSAVWLIGIALGITVVMAVVYQPGRIGECSVTPEQYWIIGDRCISKMDTLYLSTVTRAGGLLAGAALALLWRPVAVMRGPLRNKGALFDLAALVGLIGLAAMVWWVPLITPAGADAFLFRGGFLVCGILTLMMLVGVTHQRGFSGRLLGSTVLVWIGVRSYGLYLYHWPIYQAIRKVAGNPLSLWQFVLAMILTVAITEASFRFIETPIRARRVAQWWRNLRQSPDPLPRQVVVASGVAVAVIASFGVVTLAAAPLQDNEIAISLDENVGAVVDLGDLVGGETAPATSVPTETGATDPSTGPATDSTAVATTTTTTSTTTTTTLPPEPITFLAVGDSVMLGAAQQLQNNGVVVDAEVSRQMIDMIPVMEQLRDRGLFGTAVVVHLGTNGPISQETIDRFMEPLSQVPNVVVLTARANRGWTAPNNELLRALASRPNVIVLDWEALAAECPGNCFYSDGIHLRPEGQQYYSRLIFDVLGI